MSIFLDLSTSISDTFSASGLPWNIYLKTILSREKEKSIKKYFKREEKNINLNKSKLENSVIMA